MALRGDLASVDLAQVFQMLALNQKVGLLAIQGPETWQALYFDNRGVTLYFNEHLLLDKVLGNMERSGHLQTDAVSEAREHAANTGHTVVESLLAGGYLTEEELEQGFRHEMEEEIYDLFFWRDARFEFFEGATGFEGRDGVINQRFFFTTDSLIMEAARRIDEWTFIKERVPGPEEIFRPAADNGNVMELDDAALSVFELVDGKRNVERLIEVTGLSAFHVFKSLAHLLEQQMIEHTPPHELISAAQECVAEGRLRDAINLYERAIDLEEGLPDTHALAAEAYEATQQYDLATYHLKCVAEYAAGAGDVAKAVGLLQHVIELMPTDLAARERFVELTIGVPEFKNGACDPVAEGKILVDLYIEIGEIDRVRGILEKLLRDNPDDIELKKSLINVHTKAGDSKRVIELYDSIAKDLVQKGEPIEAVKYLQKILMIDRSRRDVSERIRSLYEMDERRRARRRTMAALAAMLCVLAALGVVWYFYEQHARDHFDHLDVSQLLESKEFVAAATVYTSFIQSYPFTLVASDAEAQLARIDSLRLAHEAQLKQQSIKIEAEKNRRRGKYRQEWEEYLADVRAQNLASALEHVENVRRMVTEIGDAVDDRWAAEVRLDNCVSQLRVYIGEAAALEREARALLAEGKWREAREKLLVLTSKYDITEVARRARVPVLLTSMPAGAMILENGKPITASGDAGAPLLTPAVVYCQPKGPNAFELQREGFRPLAVEIDPHPAAESHHVLTIIPDVEVEFETAVHTGVGAAGGHLVVGLRGGKIGIARVGDAAAVTAIQLAELREVVGTPVVVSDRMFVRTNEGELKSYTLPSGKEAFAVRFEDPLAHDPTAKDGRLLAVDVKGRLSSVDMSTGQVLWTQRLPGELPGPASVQQRIVRVGTEAGEYLMLDAADGTLVRRFSGLPGITSSVLSADGIAFFTTQNGKMVALNETSGRLVWETDIGVSGAGGQPCMVGGSLLVLGGNDTLYKMRVDNGRKEASFALPGRRVSGPVCSQSRCFVTVREEVDESHRNDLLLALDVEQLVAVWEFRDGGVFRGPVTTDGFAAYLPGSNAKVLRFR